MASVHRGCGADFAGPWMFFFLVVVAQNSTPFKLLPLAPPAKSQPVMPATQEQLNYRLEQCCCQMPISSGGISRWGHIGCPSLLGGRGKPRRPRNSPPLSREPTRYQRLSCSPHRSPVSSLTLEGQPQPPHAAMSPADGSAAPGANHSGQWSTGHPVHIPTGREPP